MKVCIVEECGEKHVARGYCQNHYRVFMRRGTPIAPKRTRKIHVATGGYMFRTVGGKTRYLHIEATERAIWKPLPVGAEVHHVNGAPNDNRNENLVVCPNHEYRILLHQRARARDTCGNASFRPCKICGEYDAPESMNKYRKQYYHALCSAIASKARRAKQKEVLP